MDLIVKRLDDTEIVKFGPDAIYQPIIGDDEGTTPVRTRIVEYQDGVPSDARGYRSR